MKKCLLILSILFLSCSNQCNNKNQPIPPNDTNESNAVKPLIIGGKQYYNLFPKKALTLADIESIESLVFDIDPIDPSSMDDLDGIEQFLIASNIKEIYVNINNLDKFDLSPLEQFENIIELEINTNGNTCVLPNFTSFKLLEGLGIRNTSFNDSFSLVLPSSLKGFAISGTNLYKVDLSAVETLHELTGLRIEGDITKLPNLTKLEKLRSIIIEHTRLESLEGIGAPNARRIEIFNIEIGLNSLASLNNLLFLEELLIIARGSTTLRITDISNLPSLRNFILLMPFTNIDLLGIENLRALENILFSEFKLNLINIEGIGKLVNLKKLAIKIAYPEPSLEFLRDMPNLSDLSLIASPESLNNTPNGSLKIYQVLDMRSIATLKNLRNLSCTNFIIKNIASLDVLDALSIQDDESFGYINLIGCKLFNDTDKSSHPLVLEHPVK